MGTALDPTIKPDPRHWHASLSLRFARRGESGCRLMSADREGPLAVQRPFYPEGKDLPHCYVLHPPGGLVSGDRLAIQAHCEPGSQALITTPGAGRAYRAREQGSRQRQQQHFVIDDKASLEWLPMETIVYPGAALSSETDFYLYGASHLIAWDIICLGLPASNAPFLKGTFQQRLRIFHDDQLALLDRFALTAPSPLQSQPVGLNHKTVLGCMVAGPFDDKTAVGSCIDLMRKLELPIALTMIDQWLLIRYLGDSAFEARNAFGRCWQQCRPLLLNRPVCLPRIWAT